MANERKKKTDDFDIFAATASDSKRRRIAAPVAPAGKAGGPSGPAMSSGPSGPAMRGSGPSGPAMSGKGTVAPAQRRRRSADDKDLKALYGN